MSSNQEFEDREIDLAAEYAMETFLAEASAEEVERYHDMQIKAKSVL